MKRKVYPLVGPLELVRKEKNMEDNSSVDSLRQQIQLLKRKNQLLQEDHQQCKDTLTKLEHQVAYDKEQDAIVINQLQNSETRLAQQLEIAQSKMKQQYQQMFAHKGL